MSNDTPKLEQTRFTVIACASGAIHFPKESTTEIQANYPEATLDIVIGSRRIDVPNVSKPVKFGLYATVTGHARNAEVAIDQFLPPVSATMAALAVVTNAAVGEVELELAFDSTPGREVRPFLRNYLPPAEYIPLPPRTVNGEALPVVLRAIANHSRPDRLHIAIVQYYQALQHWKPGHDTLALSHLWMGIEALTPVVLEAYLVRSALTREKLLEAWNIEKNKLDPEVRRRLIFAGDDDTYRKTKDASDAYEHGYKLFDEVLALSRGTRDLTAKYLRRAILEHLAIDDDLRRALLSHPYNDPLAPHLSKYLRGFMLPDGEQLSAAARPYPEIRWAMHFEDGVPDSPETTAIKVLDSFTPVIANNAKVSNLHLEVWALGGIGDAGSLRADPPIWKVSGPAAPPEVDTSAPSRPSRLYAIKLKAKRLIDRVAKAFKR